jgi:cytohesin
MMQNSFWAIGDTQGNLCKEIFSIKNYVPNESKKKLILQSFSLTMASAGFRILEELQEKGASMEDIACRFKKIYEIKYGNVWHCIVGEESPISWPDRSIETIIIKSCDITVYLWRTSRQDSIQIFEDVGILNLIDDKISDKSTVDDWINDHLIEIREKRIEDFDHYEDLFRYLRESISQNIGRDWGFMAGKRIVNTITSAENTNRMFSVICKNGMEIAVFKGERGDALTVNHSIYATLHHYGEAFFNFEKTDQLSPNSFLTVAEIQKTLRLPFPVQIEYSRGLFLNYCSFRYGLKIYLQIGSHCYFWLSNVNCPQLQLEKNEVIFEIVKWLKMLSPYPELRQDLPFQICIKMQLKFGGFNWCCTLADANSYQHVIYHNGNYFNFVIGELMVVLYQPGLICSEDGKVFEYSVPNSDVQTILDTTCSVSIFKKYDVIQDFYHCNTCRVKNGEGICMVCANICHKGHDIEFAKFDKFSCACDSEMGESCLVKSISLHVAAKSGLKEIVEFLLKNGADVNSKSADISATPLHVATEKGYRDVIEVLLQKGADVDARTTDHGATPLHVATEKGYRDVIEVLLQKGANVDARTTDHGATPLHVAAQNGQKEIVEVLLENKADVNAETTYHTTPLYLACLNDQKEVVEVLLKYGARVNAETTDEGATPLHWAASYGFKEVVEVLLENGADVKAKTAVQGATPLHWAAGRGHSGVVKLLLQKGADALATDNYSTILHYAVHSNNEEVIRLILDKIKDFNEDSQLMNPHINAPDNEGDTPLMLAAYSGKMNAAQILLEYKAGINVKNEKGMTALHWAAKGGHKEIVQLLLDNHADPNIKNKEEKDPLDLAEDQNVINLLAALLRT